MEDIGCFRHIKLWVATFFCHILPGFRLLMILGRLALRNPGRAFLRFVVSPWSVGSFQGIHAWMSAFRHLVRLGVRLLVLRSTLHRDPRLLGPAPSVRRIHRPPISGFARWLRVPLSTDRLENR